MEQLLKVIQMLEKLQENTDIQGNSASNILRETGNFIQYDLDRAISLLQDARNELESKTTPKAATSEVV
ncbi:hypothetical protein [Paenibacillus xylanexedens]|uniref:hypothetical protein n=1 Tax=Paenibacillus xylanexedens TaxID=528191 RepID=UPI0011A9484B|nr:hypothetical protein [Paenibacillus xylanexedens]